MTHLSVAVAAACLPLLLALLALIAWTSGALRLASFHSDYIPMAPSTAIGFLMAGGAIVASARGAPASRRTATRAAAGILTGLALIKLVQFFTGSGTLNLETALIAEPGDFGPVPLARMSPISAITFLLTGLALASLAAQRNGRVGDRGGILGGCVTLVGSTVVLGYVYQAPLLYGGRIIPMALTTGLAFVGIGVALIALAGPAHAPLRPFAGSSARARLMRVFLPLAVLTLLMTGVLTHVILARSRANPALLSALFAVAASAVVGIAVSWVARTLGGAIDRAEAVLRASHEELEEAVRTRTAELSALNGELEAFSYSVSHDLRAPLRHVIAFAGMLREESWAHLDESNRHYLFKIAEAARRMNRLIDDLLALSRAGRTPLEKRLISFGALVREAQAEVVVQAEGREILWHVEDPLPEVLADPGLLRLVLVNLLSNAVKYTARQRLAEIEIGVADTGDDETVLFVRDNGVGFDMEYAHKLFKVFQRLHRAEEFEGTGVGLANVGRIIRRHGGRAWAEAQVDRGATFFIALPKEAKPPRGALSRTEQTPTAPNPS